MTRRVDKAFKDVAPPELLKLIEELGLPMPNPVWYVGPLLSPSLAALTAVVPSVDADPR